MDEDLVYFKCIKVGRRLRVRITSPGYRQDANCQFPRAVRVEGGTYSASKSDVSFSVGPGHKFFYRVSNSKVNVIGEKDVNIEKIFQDDEPDCVICMTEEKSVVIAPCGHYCLCNSCALTVKRVQNKCPICRSSMEKIVKIEDISMN